VCSQGDLDWRRTRVQELAYRAVLNVSRREETERRQKAVPVESGLLCNPTKYLHKGFTSEYKWSSRSNAFSRWETPTKSRDSSNICGVYLCHSEIMEGNWTFSSTERDWNLTGLHCPGPSKPLLLQALGQQPESWLALLSKKSWSATTDQRDHSSLLEVDWLPNKQVRPVDNELLSSVYRNLTWSKHSERLAIDPSPRKRLTWPNKPVRPCKSDTSERFKGLTWQSSDLERYFSNSDSALTGRNNPIRHWAPN
jgi:hypothetical protein